MASPLDYILQGAKNILDKGKEAFTGITKTTGDVVNKLFYEQSTPPQQFIKNLTGLKSPAETNRQTISSSRASQLPKSRLDQFGLPISTIGKPSVGNVQDILKTATPKENLLLARENANIATGFAGYAPEKKLLTTFAPQIAKSKIPTTIYGFIKKEIPTITDDLAQKFSVVFRDMSNVQQVDTALNKIKFQFQNKNLGNDIISGTKAIIETGKPLENSIVSNTPISPLIDGLKKGDKIVAISKNTGKKTETSFLSSTDGGIMAIEPTSGLPMRYKNENFDFVSSNLVQPKKVTEADRLIASGDIRVKYVNGADVYQYKKGGEWVNARDEDSAVKQVTRVPESKAVQLPTELENKILDVQLKEQVISENPLNSLIKYSAKRGDMKGRLPEVLGKGKSEFGKKGDSIVTEALGQDVTSEEARNEFESFVERKQQLEKEKVMVKNEIKDFRKTVREEKQQAQLLKSQKLSAPQESSRPLTTVGQEATSVPYKGSTGEVRSLEKVAKQSSESAKQSSQVELPSLPKIISQQTPVSKKVGVLDYIRTPENVLKKIGLEKAGQLVRDGYEAYVKELPKNIDKITAWSKRVPKESNQRIFRYLDNQAIDLNPEELKVANEIKDWLKQWAERLNLPVDNRIAEYITHIFDDQLLQKEFDEDLAKIIADKIPGSVYDPFLLKRLGAKGYIEDTWRALDAYVKRATRKVHMDPALERLEDVSSGLEESQWDYVKKYADRINMRPTKFDNLVDNQIKQSVIGYRFGQRPVANISRTLRQMTFRGMLGLNLGSAMRNLTQGVNTYAKLGEKYTTIGYLKLFTNGLDELKETGVLADNFVQDRALSSTRKTIEKMDKGLFFFFDLAEKINRGSAYYGAKSKAIAQGKTEEQAIEFAKKIVRDTQFQYGSIDTPLAMSSDVVKVFLQFLTYPVKQTEFLAGMAKNKEYMGIARYVLGGLAVVYTVGKAMGMDPTELIPWYNYISGQSTFGVPPSLKLPYEVGRAMIPGSTNDYGKVRSVKERVKDISNNTWGVFPAGTQAKKTYQGITTVQQGGSYDSAGKLQFPQGESIASKAQSILFGKYAGQNAKDYFAGDTIAKKAQDKIKPIYGQVQKLNDAGQTDQAQAIVDGLSDAEYEVYKSIKTAEKAQKTLDEKKRLTPLYLEVQKLANQGKTDEAQAKVDTLTDEEYRIYGLIKDSYQKQDQLKEVINGKG